MRSAFLGTSGAIFGIRGAILSNATGLFSG